MPQSFGKNTMSLRASVSAVRGNHMNSEGIASQKNIRNDNQSQLSEALPQDIYL